MSEDVNMRTLLVKTRRDGEFKVTVPDNWKITFSAFQPGRGQGFGEEGNALRMYEGNSQQRACFTGVTSFRDLSIKVEKLKVTKNGKREWQDLGDGNIKESNEVQVDSVWETDNN